ncbi:hypothetical protein [Bacillus sp. MMSF_3328]|uniref:hypothetical protein n=1 Tax=Bacillus sp. MMSF_3328 TaxID=3047080 RepID=UPI00273EF5DC|nr:hypothetical protein [Bacillus sp. MMSF_3328]
MGEHDYLSKVTTWQMTPEELAAYREKYPPKMPLSASKKRLWKRITKEQYMKYKKQGLTIGQIANKFPGISREHIKACIERWGVEE